LATEDEGEGGNGVIYLELLKALEEKGIRYVVVGGVAVVLHGFVRATMDLDLIVSLEAGNTGKFLQLVKELGYRPKAPVPLEDFAKVEKRNEWVETKGMIVFSLHHSKRVQELVDVFVEEPIPFDNLYARRIQVPVEGCLISVASNQDLRTLKRAAGRPQDLEDVRALEELETRKKS
jgi:predicted nucleotidyltransferase